MATHDAKVAKLATARTINGHSFDGSANITLVPSDLGLSATSGTSVLKGDGSGGYAAATNADLPAMSATVGGAVPTPPNNTSTFLRGDGSFSSVLLNDVGIFKGSSTLSVGTSSTIFDSNCTSSSKVMLQSTSAAFGLLNAYISAVGSSSFTITHSTALGTETFAYLIIN